MCVEPLELAKKKKIRYSSRKHPKASESPLARVAWSGIVESNVARWLRVD